MDHRHTFLTLALSAALASPAVAAPEGPPYYDKTRGIEKQQNAAKDALGEIKGGNVEKAWEHLTSPSVYVRDAVFLEIVKSWSDAELVSLARGLASPDPFIAGQVAEALGTKKVKGAVAALEDALRKHRNEEVLAEICWALGEIGQSSSAKELERAIKSYERKSYRVTGEAYQALALCEPKKAAEHLQGGLKSKLAGVKIACLAQLVAMQPKEGLEAALAELDQKQEKGWENRVLFQALECFRAPQSRKPYTELYKTVIDTLIPRLAKDDGRLKHDVGKTLRSLTGQWDMGDEHDAWKYWWEVTRDRFVPIDRDPEKSGDEAAAGGTVARYFGIPVYSKRIVFLLDLSGGMKRPVGGDGSDTPERLRVAKEELSNTLQTLDKDVMANVMFFASQFYACAPGLLPIQRAMRQILKYIDDQQIPDKMHENRGNMFDPTIAAALQDEVDTIYLVTEGNPTEGRYVDRDRYVRNQMRTLKFTKTEVHAIFIGSAASAKRYLTDVSAPTGGRFYDVAALKGWK